MFNAASSPMSSSSQTAFFSPMRRASNLDTGYAAPGSGAHGYSGTDGSGRGYQNYQQPYSAGHSGAFGTSPTTSTGRLGVGSGGAGGLASSFASTLARSASLGGSRKKAADDVESGFMGLPTHNSAARIRDEEYGDEDGYLASAGPSNPSYGYYSSTPGRSSNAGPPAFASKQYPHPSGNAQALSSAETIRQAPSKLAISMQPPPPPNRQGGQGPGTGQGTLHSTGPDTVMSAVSEDARSMQSVPPPSSSQGQLSTQDYVRLSAGSGTSSRSGSSMSIAIAGSPAGDQNTAMNASDPWPQYSHRPANTYEPAAQSNPQWQQPRRASHNQQFTTNIPHVEISPEYTTNLSLSTPVSAQTSPYYSPRNPQREQFSSSSPYTADPSPNRDAYGNADIPVAPGQNAGTFGNYLQPSSSTASSGQGSPMAYSPSNSNNLPYLPTTAHPAAHGSRQLLGSRSRSSQTFTQHPGFGLAGHEDGRSGQYSGYAGPGNGNQGNSRSPRDAQRPESGQGAPLTVDTSGAEDKWARPGLRRVRDPARDLQPVLNNPPSGKRADPENSGEFLNVRLSAQR